MSYKIKIATPRRKQPRKTNTDDGLVTFDQYYEMVDESERADLLDGKIIRDSPAVPKHGRTITWVTKLIGYLAEEHDLGEVFGTTTTVRLTKYQGPEPDVFFIRKDRQGIIVDEKYIDGPPDLCVEVISKSSRKIDRGRKFVLYADHGVREYWIIDPIRDTVEFYENQEGEWKEIKPDEEGKLHSKVLPDLWIKPEWLAAHPLPPVLQVLREILGRDKLL